MRHHGGVWQHTAQGGSRREKPRPHPPRSPLTLRARQPWSVALRRRKTRWLQRQTMQMSHGVRVKSRAAMTALPLQLRGTPRVRSRRRHPQGASDWRQTPALLHLRCQPPRHPPHPPALRARSPQREPPQVRRPRGRSGRRPPPRMRPFLRQRACGGGPRARTPRQCSTGAAATAARA